MDNKRLANHILKLSEEIKIANGKDYQTMFNKGFTDGTSLGRVLSTDDRMSKTESLKAEATNSCRGLTGLLEAIVRSSDKIGIRRGNDLEVENSLKVFFYKIGKVYGMRRSEFDL